MLSLQLMLPVAGCRARVSQDLMALHGERLIKGEEAVIRGEKLKQGSMCEGIWEENKCLFLWQGEACPLRSCVKLSITVCSHR